MQFDPKLPFNQTVCWKCGHLRGESKEPFVTPQNLRTTVMSDFNETEQLTHWDCPSVGISVQLTHVTLGEGKERHPPVH